MSMWSIVQAEVIAWTMSDCYDSQMKHKHDRTLSALSMRPTQGSIVFADIEALVIAMGGEVREGAGSRVVFELRGARRYLHRPHPGKEAKKYQVEELREWLRELKVLP